MTNTVTPLHPEPQAAADFDRLRQKVADEAAARVVAVLGPIANQVNDTINRALAPVTGHRSGALVAGAVTDMMALVTREAQVLAGQQAIALLIDRLAKDLPWPTP
jgi:hypothetical protein